MLWLYLLVIGFAGGLVFFIALIVFLLLCLIVFFSLQFSALALLLYLIFFILFLIVAFITSSAIQGTSLNISRDFLEKGKLDFWSAWGKTKPRIFTSVKVEIVVGLFFLLVFLISFLPFIFSLIDFVASLNFTDLLFLDSSAFLNLFAPLIVSFLSSLLIFFIISLIIIPFSMLYRQIPFFESKGAVDSIKRAINLARKNYVKNFVFYFIFIVFVIAVSLVYTLVLFILMLPVFMGVAWLLILFTFLRIIIQIAFSIWVSVLSFLFDSKVYLINVEGTHKEHSHTTIKKTPIKKRSAKKRKK